MRKVLCKSLICVITLILLLNIFTAISYADNFDLSPYGNNASAPGNANKIIGPTKKVAGIIVSAVRITGTGIALIMITVIGIKYIIASPGDRADIKKSSIQYVVGAIIVFGSSQILALMVNILPGLVSQNQ